MAQKAQKKSSAKSRRNSNQGGPGSPGAKGSAGVIDRQLARYREMRDFGVTGEPAGGNLAQTADTPRAGGLPFVIQKHAATRLHYDFRLGLHGVLKSWAVTKGPSYVTADKRLAVQVEDHPIEYGGFEGTIPKGQYGGGTVMLWDEGTWEPVGDPDEGLSRGNLKFILHGQKLRGKWVLVRMGGRAASESKPNWLLIKEHDEYERGPQDPPITEEEPNSVATQRDLDAIAHDQDHVWQSSGPQRSAGKSPAKKIRPSAAAPPAPRPSLPGERENLPEFIQPQLASQASRAPGGADWIHELKLDGYRIQAHVDRSPGRAARVRLFTRGGLDWTHRMPAIARDLERLNAASAVLDGEVVALNSSGQPSFAQLQAAFDEHKPTPLTYFAFDLLHLDGSNLRGQPLIERKRLLPELLATLPEESNIRLSQHIEGNGPEMFSEACRLGAEGIISKRGAAPYVSGRSSSWVKVKCIRGQEFVVGGFTLPSNGSNGIGALLLGYYRDDKLLYAGRTGTGFTQSSSRAVRKSLEALRREKSPFTDVPAEARRGVIWTKPEMVVEVQFSTWTADHRVRQASFKGIREDKKPSEIHREEPDPTLVGAASAGKPKEEKKSKTSTPAKPAAGESKPPSHKLRTNKAINKASKETASSPAGPAVRITHPERIIDPETKLTKEALVDYYLAVAEHMLPHVAGRPLSLVRCPQGAGEHCFFQKHFEKAMPAGVEGVDVPNKNGKGSETYVTLATAEALAGLAQMNVLEIHPWGAKNSDLEHPDRLIFDLDPDEAVSWQTLCDSAGEVRERLDKLGLKSFLKTTGGKGLHVVAPIRPEQEWNVVKSIAQAFAFEMERENSKLYIAKMTKAARKNKIFVDYMRNERGSTAIAPYSSRARRGLTAALPLPWTALKASERPRFPIADFANWKNRLGRDPWKGMAEVDQQLPPELLEAAQGR